MVRSRGHFITVYKSITGWTAVMMAEYEDKPGQWMLDNVQTGIGKYRTREGAEAEAKDWAKAENVPYKGWD